MSRKIIVVIRWIAVLTPALYGLSRVAWAAGIPIGIDRALLDELDAPGWGSLYILALVTLSETTAYCTHHFLIREERSLPQWLPVASGRPLTQRTVLAMLAAPLAVLWLVMASSVSLLAHGLTDAQAGLPGWSSWLQIATFWIWGTSLTAALGHGIASALRPARETMGQPA